ncbi:MAG: hypothetical protein KGH89_05820 [Thaumarchaeota archaeon]|nr:hypothetical protein [Nitrososphaerota archaeon]
MSVLTANKLNSQTKQMNIDKIQISKKPVSQLTVSSMIKIMFEIIQVKKVHDMNEATRRQFQRIAKEVILLSEQIQ